MLPLLVLLLFAGFVPISAHAQADAVTPQPAVIVEQYTGGYKDEYPIELVRVKTYLIQAQQNIASQLGLNQYGQGFSHPVQIHFGDGSPVTSENPYFYVQPVLTNKGYEQDFMVNVEAFARYRKNPSPSEQILRHGFYYAMASLILNDIAGGKTDQMMPVWAQEGLAIYVSGKGDELVERIGKKTTFVDADRLASDLNATYPYLTPKEYADYYLAIRYIFDTGGVNALQGFVRELINGKTPAQTIEAVLNLQWPDFEKQVRIYSLAAYKKYIPPEEPQTQQYRFRYVPH